MLVKSLFSLTFMILLTHGAEKTFNPVNLKKGSSTVNGCESKVTYTLVSGSCDVSGIKTKCKSNKSGVYAGKIDMAGTCPCEVSFETAAKKSYKTGSKITESCSTAGGGGGGNGKECTCSIPGIESIMSRSATPNKILLPISGLMNNIRSSYPGFMSLLRSAQENEFYSQLSPVFQYIEDGSFAVDQSTSLVEFVAPKAELRTYRPRPRPSTGLGALVPLILIPLLAALLPGIVAAIINIITGNRMLLNSENISRVEALVRALEHYSDEDFFSKMTRHGSSSSFGGIGALLLPLLTIALGFLIGNAIRMALGLRRSSLDMQLLNKNSEEYRLLAFSRAMQMHENDFLKKFPDFEVAVNRIGGGSAIQNMILLQIVQALIPFITNIVTELRNLIGLVRMKNPALNTENIRGLETTFKDFEYNFLRKANPQSRQLGDPCLNIFLRPTLTTLGFCVSGTMPIRILNVIANLNQCKSNAVCTAIINNAKEFAGGNTSGGSMTDVIAGKMKKIVDDYMKQNGSSMLSKLEASKTQAKNFVDTQGEKIMEDGMKGLSEISEDMKQKFKEMVTKYLGKDGFKITCNCPA